MEEPGGELIEVPYGELSDTALAQLVESFCLREGTDYGDAHFTLAQKVGQVMRQLERGEARIVFEPTTASVDIVVKQKISRRPATT